MRTTHVEGFEADYMSELVSKINGHAGNEYDIEQVQYQTYEKFKRGTIYTALVVFRVK